MKESDILFQAGNFWVTKINGIFYVMKDGLTHAESVCGFDEQSKAFVYAAYLGGKP